MFGYGSPASDRLGTILWREGDGAECYYLADLADEAQLVAAKHQHPDEWLAVRDDCRNSPGFTVLNDRCPVIRGFDLTPSRGITLGFGEIRHPQSDDHRVRQHQVVVKAGVYRCSEGHLRAVRGNKYKA